MGAFGSITLQLLGTDAAGQVPGGGAAAAFRDGLTGRSRYGRAVGCSGQALCRCDRAFRGVWRDSTLAGALSRLNAA